MGYDDGRLHRPASKRPRMSTAQRAKIFIPFDPLKGFQEALREVERESERARLDNTTPAQEAP